MKALFATTNSTEIKYFRKVLKERRNYLMGDIKKIIFSFVMALTMIGILTISNAATISEKDIQEFLSTHTSIDVNNITESDVITIYEELSDKYTNEEMADIIDTYSEELKKEGISQDTINAVITLLRTTDTQELKRIMEEDLDINSIKAKLDKGEDIEAVVNEMPINIGEVFAKLLLANMIVKTFLMITLILVIYGILVRWKMYSKANKHGWAAIVPIYRDVVWLKISGISPWVLLLWLLPVIGWIILAIIMIVSKFRIAKAFGESAWFGLGIWILPVIFETIIAFSKDFEYIGFEEK